MQLKNFAKENQKNIMLAQAKKNKLIERNSNELIK